MIETSWVDGCPGMHLPRLVLDGVEHMPESRYVEDLLCTCGSWYPCKAVREHHPEGVEWAR